MEQLGKKLMREPFVVEDGTVPGAVRHLYGLMLTLSAQGRMPSDSNEDWFKYHTRIFSGEAVDNSLANLVMSHDNFDGIMTLQDGRVNIASSFSRQAGFEKIANRLKKATERTGALYINNPTWQNGLTEVFKNLKSLITVHPLGGCKMGESAQTGVVNHRCQVLLLSLLFTGIEC